MAIIKDYISPRGCHIVVHDDYMVKTREEAQKIIDNLSQIVVNELLRQQAQGGEGKKEK